MKRNLKNYTRTTSRSVEDFARAYCRCRNLFTNQHWRDLDEVFRKDNSIRNEYVRGLKGRDLPKEVNDLLGNVPARMWKNALTDSLANIKTGWSNLEADVKAKVGRTIRFTKEEKHYLYYVLKVPSLLDDVLHGVNRKVEKFERLDLPKMNRWLRRTVRNNMFGKSVTKSLVYHLDENQYKFFKRDGKSFIRISTLALREREEFELTSSQTFSGTLTIVPRGNHFEIHKAEDIKQKKNSSEEEIGLDKGCRALISTSTGNQYGKDFSQELKKASEKLNRKGKERAKFREQAKKALASGNKVKADKINTHNLGTKKLVKTKKKKQEQQKSFINGALNQFFKKEKIGKLAVEDLKWSSKFTYGKNVNRWLSTWTKGYLQQRLEFKAFVHCIDLVSVNPAYTSKLCNQCGSFGDRKGAEFHCTSCGLRMDADLNAARNILERMHEPDIQVWTSSSKVRDIVQQRMLERKMSSATTPFDDFPTEPSKTFSKEKERSVLNSPWFKLNLD